MYQDSILKDLSRLKQLNPVIHNVTNLVVMQTTANILLAIGASPIMAHAPEELADIAAIANALVINIGTLDKVWIEAITVAQQAARRQNIPIVFDPVGAGASRYRTHCAKSILQNGVHILRGNASEIIALMDSQATGKGVDARHLSEEAIAAAQVLAERYNCIVVISGKVDIVVSDSKAVFIDHGTALFTSVTGMGCSATALIAAFAAVNNNYTSAAVHAMTAFSIAGEIAAQRAAGPGSFYPALLDVLFSLAETKLKELNITEKNYVEN